MIEMNWFLPTGGDSRDVLPDADTVARAPSVSYMSQIAQACEGLGFNALLTPCGTGCEDAWIATAALLSVTTRLKFWLRFDLPCCLRRLQHRWQAPINVCRGADCWSIS